jgi:hypothetical protein
MLLLDLPLLVESQYQYGFQWAKRPNDTGAWAGASLQRSVDGSTYSEVASSTVRDVIGTASGALPDFPGGNTFDESSVLTVALNSGELSSVTSDVLLGDRTANLYCVGRELLQVRDWELIATNTWEGTGMLRGRFGTETAMAVHETGERFAQVPVTDVDAPFADLNRTRYYKPVTFSTSLDDVLPETFVNTGLRLKPLSPVQLGGGSDGDGNATLQWVPRSRIGGGFGAIPLGEAAERYVVEIRDYSQTQVARIKIVDDAQEVEYPASEQVEDFGDEQQNIYFSVALVGSIGLGQRAFGSVPGVGDSDDAPLAPIAPYGTGPLNPPPSGAVNGELVWSPTGPHYTQGYLVGQTYVVEFTAGATTTATVSCAQHGDPPFFRRLRICTDSSGVDLLPNGENIGTTASATVNVSNGVTYYAVITCEESPGVPSGPLGADADMIIELSHP